MLLLWQERAHCTKLLAPGKLPGEHLTTSSPRCSPTTVNAQPLEIIPTLCEAVTSKAAYTLGTIDNQILPLLMDSGASCSVIQKDHMSPGKIKPAAPIKLMNANGSGVSPIGNVEIQVKLGGMETSQAFVVVDKLSAPAILGCDFLKRFHVFIDFGDSSFGSRKFPDLKGQLLLRQVHLCNLVLDNEYPQAIPHRTETSESELDMPTDYHPSLESTIKKHSSVFRKKLGHMNVTQHIIDTGNSQPIKVPPRPIPFHFADRVHAQLEEMSNEGIIRPSSSPWCAPAVYVPKDNGEVRICVDFAQLNKTTKKDSYPVPRADGPQQKLANKTVFSKIDLRSAYWQFPMDSGSIEKLPSALALDMAYGSSLSCHMASQMPPRLANED